MLPVEVTGSMLKGHGTTTSNEAPIAGGYSLTAWQLPFLLDAGDENYIKGFEDRNHRKLWVRNF